MTGWGNTVVTLTLGWSALTRACAVNGSVAAELSAAQVSSQSAARGANGRRRPPARAEQADGEQEETEKRTKKRAS
jgi:hypothetical protein